MNEMLEKIIREEKEESEKRGEKRGEKRNDCILELLYIFCCCSCVALGNGCIRCLER